MKLCFLLTASIALLFGFGLIQNQVLGSTERTKVAIIGSGAAAISAAKVLDEQNVDFVILEARDRIGGRLYSTDFHGVSIDHGGAWIQGTEGSKVWEWKEEFDIKCSDSDFYDMPLYDQNGDLLTESELDDAYNSMNQVYAHVLQRANELWEQGKQDISIGEIVDELNYRESSDARKLAIQKFMIWFYYEWEYGDSIDKIGVLTYNSLSSPHELYKDEDCYMLEGYDTLFKKIAEKFEDKIILNQEVTHVTISENSVVLNTKQGDTFEADYVISTPNMMVLNSGAIEFEPKLPDYIPLHWHFAGAAAYLKIVLYFEDGDDFFQEIPETEFFGVAHDDYSHFHNLNHEKYFPGSHMLVATVTGEKAREINSMSDSQVIDEVMAVLRSVFANAPQPADMMKTAWESDPFSRGAWLREGVGAYTQYREALRNPIHGRVFLAGDGISYDSAGYVHGAVDAGTSQANIILDMVQHTDNEQSGASHTAVNVGVVCVSLFSVLTVMISFF